MCPMEIKSKRVRWLWELIISSAGGSSIHEKSVSWEAGLMKKSQCKLKWD